MRPLPPSLALAIRCLLLVAVLGFPVTGCDDTPDDDTDGDSDVDADSFYPCGCDSDDDCPLGSACIDCWCIQYEEYFCSSHQECWKDFSQCDRTIAYCVDDRYLRCRDDFRCIESDACVTKSFCFPDCPNREYCEDPITHVPCETDDNCEADEFCKEISFCTTRCEDDADCPDWRPVCRDATWCSQQ